MTRLIVMTTDWAVTTATERIKLDAHRKASTTFSVTNPGQRPDRVVFDVLPGEGTAEDWFTVDSPQRLVPGGTTVSYVVETTVPVGVPDGTYSYQAMVYSADVPPEENSHLSGRVTFDLVNPEPRPAPPWRLIVMTAAAVVALGIVLWLVFSGGSATVPDVRNKAEADAVKALDDAGLKAAVRHKQDPAHANLVVDQDPPGGTEVDDGSIVLIQVAVSLSRPQLASPPDGAGFDDRRVPELKWQAVAGASFYKVTVGTTDCGVSLCTAPLERIFDVRGTGFTPRITPNPNGNTIVRWTVQAVDDAGTLGPPSDEAVFRLGGIIIA